MLRICALVAGVFALCLAHGVPAARAEEPAPLVVLYAPPSAPASVSRARTALGQAARERGTVVIDLSPVAEPPPEAAQSLRRGIEAYHNFKYDVAHDELQRALQEAQQTGAAGLTSSELTDIYIYSALVASQRGDSTITWDNFIAAAAIDPTRRLDPVRFPPRVIESYQRALDAVAAAERSDVTVQVDAHCAVLFDARPARPMEAIRVARGPHYLRVICPGHAPYGARLNVSDPSPVIKPALDAPLPPTLDRVIDLALERGGRTVIFAHVTVSRGAEPTLTMQLVDVETRQEKSRIFSSVRADSRAATDIRRALQGLIDAVIAPPRNRLVTPSAPAPWYRKPWVWGVAGAAVTAAVLLPFVVGSDPSPGFSVRPGGQLPP